MFLLFYLISSEMGRGRVEIESTDATV